MIVLDTHVVIWWLDGSSRLSSRARDEIEREPRVVIPDIVCWEMAQLVLRGRLGLVSTAEAVLSELFSEPGMFSHPITPAIGLRAAGLSLNRPMDPADQLIAATALELDCPLVTADERLHTLPGLRVLW